MRLAEALCAVGVAVGRGSVCVQGQWLLATSELLSSRGRGGREGGREAGREQEINKRTRFAYKIQFNFIRTLLNNSLAVHSLEPLFNVHS